MKFEWIEPVPGKQVEAEVAEAGTTPTTPAEDAGESFARKLAAEVATETAIMNETLALMTEITEQAVRTAPVEPMLAPAVFRANRFKGFSETET